MTLNENLGELLLGGNPEDKTIEEGFRQYLKDIVGEAANVYYVRRPQKKRREFPVIIIEKDSEEREDCMDGPAKEAVFGFTLQIWGFDPDIVIRLYDTTRRALETYRGNWFNNKVCNVWIDNDSDNAEPYDDNSDDWVYGRVTSYGMIIEKL